ncbi:MAG: hypothetical protein PF448_12955 [Bacteroidales bacterium]|jgi:hypothetical protein|nr:hypothetical protein [Bacteroidales bacterium]
MDLQRAKKEMDEAFGEGYGEAHPKETIMYMQAYGLNTIREQTAEFSSDILKGLNKLSEAIESTSFRIPE